MDPSKFDAGLIGATRGYFISPEIPTALVGLAIEKIVIVLADIVAWIINYVRGRFGRIVDYGHRSDDWRAKSCAGWIAQGDTESLRSFDVRVIVDKDNETLRGLVRSKAKCADGGNVVAALARGDV